MQQSTQANPRESFPYVRTLRFSRDQMTALDYAIKVTPGCGTFAGVVRRALDDWLQRNYADQLALLRDEHA